MCVGEEGGGGSSVKDCNMQVLMMYKLYVCL